MKVGSLEDAHKPARKAGLAHSSLAKPQREAVLASRRRNGIGTFIVSSTPARTLSCPACSRTRSAHCSALPSSTFFPQRKKCRHIGRQAFLTSYTQDRRNLPICLMQTYMAAVLRYRWLQILLTCSINTRNCQRRTQHWRITPSSPCLNVLSGIKQGCWILENQIIKSVWTVCPPLEYPAYRMKPVEFTIAYPTTDCNHCFSVHRVVSRRILIDVVCHLPINSMFLSKKGHRAPY